MKNNKKIWIPLIVVIALVAILIGSIFGYKAIMAKSEGFAKEDVHVKVSYKINGSNQKDDNLIYSLKIAKNYKTFGSLIENENPDGLNSNPFIFSAAGAFGRSINNYKNVTSSSISNWRFYILKDKNFNQAPTGIDSQNFSEYTFGIRETGTDINK